MQYRYAENRNYEPYASGRVFYARPGQPAFPVRLASEIFQRTRAHWLAQSGTGRCRVFDPVCGGGYWLAALAYLHWKQIGAIYAADLDSDAISLAARNLGLLSPAGLAQRIVELEHLLVNYGKDSHRQALAEAQAFQNQLGPQMQTHPIQVQVFQADATQPTALAIGLSGQAIDIILADVPYGWHSHWQSKDDASKGAADDPEPLSQLLEALLPVSHPHMVVAIASDKGQKPHHPAYRRLEQFNAGRRRVTILGL